MYKQTCKRLSEFNYKAEDGLYMGLRGRVHRLYMPRKRMITELKHVHLCETMFPTRRNVARQEVFIDPKQLISNDVNDGQQLAETHHQTEEASKTAKTIADRGEEGTIEHNSTRKVMQNEKDISAMTKSASYPGESL